MLTVFRGFPLSSWCGADRYTSEAEAESCILIHRQERRGDLGLAWTFQTSKLTRRDSLPPTRLQLLFLPKWFINWGLSMKTYDPVGDILILSITMPMIHTTFEKVVRFGCQFLVVIAVVCLWMSSWSHWLKRIKHISYFIPKAWQYSVLLLFSCFSLGCISDCMLVHYQLIVEFGETLRLETKGNMCWCLQGNTTLLGSVCSGLIFFLCQFVVFFQSGSASLSSL